MVELGIPSPGQIWLYWTLFGLMQSEWYEDTKGKFILEKEAWNSFASQSDLKIGN
jgi:hypothetical protein